MGLEILLYVGWFVFAVGFVFFFLGPYELQKKGRVVEGDTTALVDSGIYAVIRHPFYLGGILLVSASILISQHWLTLILGVPLLAWFFIYVLPEADKEPIEKFGDDYKRYMQKVPRMNLLLGIIRRLQRRKREIKVDE